MALRVTVCVFHEVRVLRHFFNAWVRFLCACVTLVAARILAHRILRPRNLPGTANRSAAVSLSRRGRFAAKFFNFGSWGFVVLVQNSMFFGPPEAVKNHWILLF